MLDSGSGSSDGMNSTGSGLNDSGSGSATMSGGSGGLDGGAAGGGGGRFFDLIRRGDSRGADSASQQHQQLMMMMGGMDGGDAADFDPSSSQLESDAELLARLRSDDFELLAADEEEAELNGSGAWPYSLQQQQQLELQPFGLEDDGSSSLMTGGDDSGVYDSREYGRARNDEDELTKAGRSDKRIKEAMARAVYSAASAAQQQSVLPQAVAPSSAAAAAGSFAVPTRLRSMPTFYPSSVSSAFNPSIVYDDPPAASHALPPLPSLHPPPSFLPQHPPHQHGFFSSWPAPSSASPLLIIDDRQQTGASIASTASSGSSMGSQHPFSLSSPSAFDSSPIAADYQQDDAPLPQPSGLSLIRSQPLSTLHSAALQLHGPPLHGGLMNHGLHAHALPGSVAAGVAGWGGVLEAGVSPGLNRFGSPLVIIDDQRGDDGSSGGAAGSETGAAAQ